jgi:hypothetical protein
MTEGLGELTYQFALLRTDVQCRDQDPPLGLSYQ